MISDYFTQTFTLYEKIRTKSDGGVVKDSLTSLGPFKGVLDPNPSSFAFRKMREDFDFSDVLYCGVIQIEPDMIVEYGTRKYKVISVINNMQRNHHLEILLNYVS